MKIVLDGMGGDNAPFATVEGAVLAAKEFGAHIIIAGIKDVLERELSKYGSHIPNIEIHHASEIIDMHDAPAASVRKKKDSSINAAVKLVKEGKASAMVSAGNTGAVVCATTLYLRLLKGLERPGIAIVAPTLKGVSLIIDVGANIDPKPVHLLQYGIMGDVYSRAILKKFNPIVGLLNIGQEASKGTDFIKKAYDLFAKSRLNFIGNVEGRDLFNGKCDVIVCDGFVGNVVLKVSESLAESLSALLKRELGESFITRLGALFSKSALMAMKREMDYTEYGGAPLLGIDGICIICHGSSSAKAIKNAIKVAAEFVDHKVNQHIVEAIAGSML
ncbi:MAG: phosphate acyltransferase PlsX [Candidatus Omnitrophica bacterium]|nr:phosphate acyltransferase PlsX [Candidatus Omnitrophota bacterium]MBU4140911.1 phosphate acyltransferase PlsX [Candidatus Omnitrophota bacterium]